MKDVWLGGMGNWGAFSTADTLASRLRKDRYEIDKSEEVKMETLKAMAHELIRFKSFNTFDEAFDRLMKDHKSWDMSSLIKNFEENENRIVEFSLNFKTGNYNLMWSPKKDEI